MKAPKIPQMFYLRKLRVTTHQLVGNTIVRIIKEAHVFWSYRDSTPRIIETDSRDLAKEAIITGKLPTDAGKRIRVCKPNPEADFYR